MFDAARHNLSFTKKTEVSPTEIGNSEFSTDFIEQVFDGFLKNSRIEIDNLNSPNFRVNRLIEISLNKDSSNARFYYNRAENSVEFVKESDTVRFVHFYIDFNKNRSEITELLNSISSIDISNCISQNFVTKSKDDFEIEFNYIAWEELNELLTNNFQQTVVDSILVKFRRKITLEWLYDLNGIN